MIFKPVKATDFVRTVVSTIPCTNTSVVSHLIQAFTAMRCRCDRANSFAWCIVAMLAKHGLKYNFRIFACLLDAFPIVGRRVAAIVTIDSQPVHFPSSDNFVTTYKCNVVLDVTGYDTGAATDTRI